MRTFLTEADRLAAQAAEERIRLEMEAVGTTPHTELAKAEPEEEFPQYPIPPKVAERLERDFTYHAVKPGQGPRYVRLRARARDLAYQIAAYTPPGREQALALTKLEEAVFWANAAIARGEV